MHTVVAHVSGCRFHRAKARTRHGDERRQSVHPTCHAHAYRMYACALSLLASRTASCYSAGQSNCNRSW